MFDAAVTTARLRVHNNLVGVAQNRESAAMQTIRDPGLDDMLSEPMIVRLMKSDRIRAEDARALYAEVAHRIRNAPDRLAEEQSPDRKASRDIIYG